MEYLNHNIKKFLSPDDFKFRGKNQKLIWNFVRELKQSFTLRRKFLVFIINYFDFSIVETGTVSDKIRVFLVAVSNPNIETDIVISSEITNKIIHTINCFKLCTKY